MAVKLYNGSMYSDDLMKRLHTEAYKGVGLKGDVVVKVTRGHADGGASGYAKRAYAVTERWIKRGGSSNKVIHTDGAVILIRPPKVLVAMEWAEQFFSLLIHEFRHVLDHQENLKQPGKHSFTLPNRKTGRRSRHFDRPEEFRARKAEREVVAALKASGRYEKVIVPLLQQMIDESVAVNAKKKVKKAAPTRKVIMEGENVIITASHKLVEALMLDDDRLVADVMPGVRFRNNRRRGRGWVYDVVVPKSSFAAFVEEIKYRRDTTSCPDEIRVCERTYESLKTLTV